ncbi:MAG: hypothetical protein ABW321_06430 [Polyangiales bacterium]
MVRTRLGFVVAVCWLVHGVAHAADPTTADCLNANDLSIELRNQHRLRAARAELLVCAAPTCPEDIRNECAQRVGDVNAAMPTIVFEVRDGHDNDLSAVTIDMDGAQLVQRLEGTALSIDPGEHEFVFQARDLPRTSKRLIIREGEKGRREKVVLSDGLVPTEPTPPAPNALTPVGLATPGEPVDEPSGSSNGVKRIVGYAAGGVAALAFGGAIYEQVTAKSRSSKSHDAAKSDRPEVRATASTLHDQASQAQTYAIVLGAVGAVALGTSLYFLLTSMGDDEPRRPPHVQLQLNPAPEHAVLALSYTREF